MSAPKRQASSSLVCLFISFLLLMSLARECLGQEAAGSSQNTAVIASPLGMSDYQPETFKVWLGSPILREIAAGKAHSYEITIATNQFARVMLSQQGISVHLTMSDSEGKKLAEVSTPNGTQDGLQISVVTEAAGVYRLEVRSLEGNAPGSYKLELAELRPATEEDKSRVEAGRFSTRGGDLLSRGTLKSIRQAIAEYEQALPLWRKVNDRAEEANTLLKLGQGYSYLADNHKAIEFYTLALNLLPDVGYVRARINTLNSFGSIYLDLGEYQKAFTFFSKALSLSEESRDKAGVVRSLYNLGMAYRLAGEDDKALDYLGRALSLSREIGDLGTTSYILQSIGMIYISMARNADALKVLQDALALSRDLADKRGEAWGNNRVGDVYAARGEGRQALEHYTRALMLSRELGMRDGEAETLYGMGVIHAAAGELHKSLDLFSEALSLSRAITDRRTEMKALFEIAKIKRAQGALDESRQHIEAALSIVDSLHNKISDRELRSSYFASIQKYYEFYISLLMQFHRQVPSQGFDVAALQVSERVRARGLLELLTEARVSYSDGDDPSLIEREQSLRQMIAMRTQLLLRLRNEQASSAQAKSVEKEIEDLNIDYQRVTDEIRAQNLHYGTLTQPRFLSAKEIQAQIVSEDSLLLEYALCEDRSFLWAVTPSSITSYELPRRDDIERAAYKVYNLISAPSGSAATRSAEVHDARPAPSQAKYLEASSKLSDILLGPVSHQLGKKRLVIVAQGVLQFIPFGALPAPSGSGVSGQRRYLPLVVNHEIVYLPSASLGSILQSGAASRERPTKVVAVLADPVFGKTDSRVPIVSHPSGGGDLLRTRPSKGSPLVFTAPSPSVSASAGRNFPRLLSAQWEADYITSLIPPSQSLKAIGFAANRATATSPALNQYRIIHFATHALINDEQPGLSGILLSSVNDQGQEQDGFLSINDISNLKLSADLVVLSACSTGLGKEVKGEGIVGLTQAFMYAGVPRVIVSLWSVDDRATADFMARFYVKMLKDKLEPAAALRAAQIEMWRKGRQKPYYWAGFVLQGVAKLNN